MDSGEFRAGNLAQANELLGLFESVAWRSIPPEFMPRGPGQGVRIDVGARMRDMWR